MRSPTVALLVDIGRQHRWSLLLAVALTAAAWVLSLLEWGDLATDDNPLSFLLALLSFLLLLAAFNNTEARGDKGLGRFPQRLFTLPVSTLRLVALPMLAGIVTVEAFYLIWMKRLPEGGPTHPIQVGVLLAAFMVLYQTVLWTLVRLGTLRLVVLGVIANLLAVVGFLPSMPMLEPSPWRSASLLSWLAAALAVAAFSFAWWHVARQRSGGAVHRPLLQSLASGAMNTLPRHRRRFTSAASAQLWFEWRTSGAMLPLLVAAVLLVLVAPLSWFVREDMRQTALVMLSALGTPILLAIPLGISSAKPTFWSNDLALPAFVAVRPLATTELVAAKVRAAVMSAAVSWLIVVGFLCVWLTGWANLDPFSAVVMQWWAFHGGSSYAVYGAAALIVLVGALTTCRFLLTSLWSSLSGKRPLYIASAAVPLVVAIACAVFDVTRLPGWLFGDPEHMLPFVWGAALLVMAKYWLAAFTWRRIASRDLWRYLALWAAGTAGFAALAIVVWNVLRVFLPADTYRLQSLLVLLALLAVPLARVGGAAAFLADNRHR
jgi:hypothetical protein